MSHRRIVGAVLLLALIALAFPTTGEARIHADLEDVSGGPGFLERLGGLWIWAQNVLADLGAQITTKEGASVGTGG